MAATGMQTKHEAYALQAFRNALAKILSNDYLMR